MKIYSSLEMVLKRREKPCSGKRHSSLIPLGRCFSSEITAQREKVQRGESAKEEMNKKNVQPFLFHLNK